MRRYGHEQHVSRHHARGGVLGDGDIQHDSDLHPLYGHSRDRQRHGERLCGKPDCRSGLQLQRNRLDGQHVHFMVIDLRRHSDRHNLYGEYASGKLLRDGHFHPQHMAAFLLDQRKRLRHNHGLDLQCYLRVRRKLLIHRNSERRQYVR